MSIFFSKVHNYKVGYTNKEEFNLLKDEIFNKEIYNIETSSSEPIIFDIGAHIGLATLYFKMKHPDSKVFAFEPNPNIFPILEENIICNDLKNVALFNLGVANSEGIQDFYIDSSGNDCFSTGSYIPNAWNGKQKTLNIKVKTEKLSKYISQSIDILKIDVEGSENEIIRDLCEQKKLQLIKNIIIEFHPIEGRKYKRFVDILEGNGFEVTIRKDSYGTDLINILGKNRL